jgi:gliding motility-associated-like protein
MLFLRYIKVIAMKLLCTISLLFISFLFYSQENIVSNADLETINVPIPCGPITEHNIDSIMPGWSRPTGASPDFHSLNSSSNCYSSQTGPSSAGWWHGAQTPRSGDNMAGFITYSEGNDNWREYIQGSMSVPTVIGTKYAVTFYISLADNSAYAVNNLGLLLLTSPMNDDTGEYLDIQPQVMSWEVIDAKDDWVMVTDTIIADKAYTNFVIGCFLTAAELEINSAVGGSYSEAYYYLDDVSISRPKNPVYTYTDQVICLGDSFDLFAWGDSTYRWSTLDDTLTILSTTAEFTVTPSSTTSYLVRGLYNRDEVTVEVKEAPSADLGDSQEEICLGEERWLDATSSTDETTYLWSTGETTPVIVIENEDTYQVKITNECGVLDLLKVITVRDCEVVIPNGITSNGDGINDVWTIEGLYNNNKTSVKVVNRWGSLVFESYGRYSSWDGTNNGKNLPVGTYYYIVNSGKEKYFMFQGIITILR